MKPFNPSAWYWIVGGDATKAYSSITGTFVQADDPAFIAWMSDGTQPTSILSAAELGVVLAPYLLRPSDVGVLDGYQSEHASEICQQTAFKVIFNHENRLRAIERSLGLNGSPANLTPAQAVNAVKALM